MPSTFRWASVIVLLLAGCTRDDKAHDVARSASPPVASKEIRVLEVKSSADLENLSRTYLEQAEAGFTGVLEVHIAAGTYADTNWTMAPTFDKPPPAIDIVLKGTGAAIPGPSRLSGRTIRIEGLVVTSQQFATFQVEATQGVTISNCAFIDGRLTNPQMARPYLELRARGSGQIKSPVTAEITGTWFVRNFQSAEQSALLALTSHTSEPGYFHDAAIRDSVFLGNAFSSDVEIGFTRNAVIERTIFYKTWASGVFLSCKTSGAVAVNDSVMVAEDLGHMARVENCPPIEVSRTKIYARSFTPAVPTPPALHVDRAAISDRKPLDATTKVVDSAAKLPVALPPDGLRKSLDQALHP
jgi:hypothetical protein